MKSGILKLGEFIFIAVFIFSLHGNLCLSQEIEVKSGISVSITANSPPEVLWFEHDEDTVFLEYNVLPVKIGIKTRLPLEQIDFYANGTLRDSYSKLQLATLSGEEEYDLVLSHSFILRNGLNYLEIIANNEKGGSTNSNKLVVVSMDENIDLVNKEDRNAPQILASSPAIARSNAINFSKDIIQIRGTVIDDSGIKSLKINEFQTPVKSNGSFTINLPLAYGENSVKIEALDINDNIAVKRFVINRKDLTGEDFKPEDAVNFLMAIGIDNYVNWPSLNNAVRDARSVVNILQKRYKFEEKNTVLITNKEATRANIYDELKEFVERITPNDNLLVYYSGHGHYDEMINEGYWVPYDAGRNAEGDFLPNSSLMKILENINSQHMFLVVDACFSGSLFADSRRGYIENVEKYKSRWGLASGRLETVSDGSYGKNSPFANCFIKYLEDNDKEKVTVTELIQYVKVNVSEISDQTPIGNPLKMLGDEGGEFVFYLNNLE